ncbi:hypothetical protein [Flavihumibacter profundi]|uniref:hypothetical protein n=1 Tax=Flavihumibacter profundi TaxID=2716883 RepID=UPI001CC45178|nr:hypothetical protein [Flavihumibacter profundi]MBZ5859093.1 hypothetical protein [Flavihumibacter profundi]
MTSSKKILVILRHEKSLGIVDDFAMQNGFTIIPVVLDPIEIPEGVATALERIRESIPLCDVIALGTKVFDISKEQSRLIEFLQIFRENGVRDKPICMTNLGVFPNAEKTALANTGLNLFYVENDNLGRDGMLNFGPILVKALQEQ